MIEFAFYDYIKNYKIDEKNVFTIGYGEVPSNSQYPYIIQQKLDKNTDPQLPCDDFGDAGEIFIQWQIYGKDLFQVDSLYQQLNEFIYNIKSLTFGSSNYIINRRNTNGRPSNVSSSTSAFGVLTMTFNYTKEN